MIVIEVCASWYTYGDQWVAVVTGMPHEHVRIGIGATPAAALEDQTHTAIQCTGRDSGEGDALDWADGAGWLCRSELSEADPDDYVGEMPEGWAP